MLLGTDIRAIVRDARRAADRRHRAELLDRARSNARLGSLSRARTRAASSASSRMPGFRSWDRRAKRSIPKRPTSSRASWPNSCASSASTPSAAAAARRRRTSAPFALRSTRWLRQRATSARAASTGAARRASQSVASAMTAVALEQQPRPLIVGERINAQGSRKIKRLLLDDNYDDDRAGRARAGRGRRARARRLLRAHRACRRRRADARARAQARAVDRSAADDRLDRAESRCKRARKLSAGARSSTRSISKPGAPKSTSCCRWPSSTARRSSR